MATSGYQPLMQNGDSPNLEDSETKESKEYSPPSIVPNGSASKANPKAKVNQKSVEMALWQDNLNLLFSEPINRMDGWVKVAGKIGGNTSYCGEFGGRYEHPETKENIFYKQDCSKLKSINHAKNFLEVYASEWQSFLLEKYLQKYNKPHYKNIIAKAFLAVRPTTKGNKPAQLPSATGEDIYVGSRWIQGPDRKSLQENNFRDAVYFRDLFDQYRNDFPGSLEEIFYTSKNMPVPSDPDVIYERVFEELYLAPCIDLYRDAYLAYNFAPQFHKLRQKEGKFNLIPVPLERPKRVGTVNRFPLMNIVESGRYEGLPILVMLSLMVKNPDGHSANLVAVPVVGNPYKKQLYSLDYAASYTDYMTVDGKLHYHDKMSYLPGLGPTNHNQEWPELILVCDESADTLNVIRHIEKSEIEEFNADLIRKLASYYGVKPLKDIAERLGMSDFKRLDRESLIEAMDAYTLENFGKRQINGTEQLELQFRISLLLERTEHGNYCIPLKNEEKLQALMQEHKNYFIQRLQGKEKFRFRLGDQQDQREKLTVMLNKKTQFYLTAAEEKPTQIIIEDYFPDLNLSERENTSTTSLMDSFRLRLSRAYTDIFDSGSLGQFANDTKWYRYPLMLWPFPNKRKNNFFNGIEWILQIFGVVGFLKNTLKLGTEFLPAILENAGKYYYDKGTVTLAKAPINLSAKDKALAYTQEIVGGACYLTFGLIRLLMMRITSPVKSVKKAFWAGSKHSPYLGVALGTLSAAVSLVGITFAAAVLTPIILTAFTAIGAYVSTTAIGAKIVATLSTIAQWSASIPYIGSVLTTLGPVATAAASYASLVFPVRTICKRIGKIATRAIKKCWSSCCPASRGDDKQDEQPSLFKRFTTLITSAVNKCWSAGPNTHQVVDAQNEVESDEEVFDSDDEEKEVPLEKGERNEFIIELLDIDSTERDINHSNNINSPLISKNNSELSIHSQSITGHNPIMARQIAARRRIDIDDQQITYDKKAMKAAAKELKEKVKESKRLSVRSP